MQIFLRIQHRSQRRQDEQQRAAGDATITLATERLHEVPATRWGDGADRSQRDRRVRTLRWRKQCHTRISLHSRAATLAMRTSRPSRLSSSCMIRTR
eukprot:scaffold34588_cov28-Tisochrysis_lutea.AAC.2